MGYKVYKYVPSERCSGGTIISGVVQLRRNIYLHVKNYQFANRLQVEKELLAGSVISYRKQSEAAQKFLKYLSKCGDISQFDDDIFLEYVEKIVVSSREKVVFTLKCGLNLPERLVK